MFLFLLLIKYRHALSHDRNRFYRLWNWSMTTCKFIEVVTTQTTFDLIRTICAGNGSSFPSAQFKIFIKAMLQQVTAINLLLYVKLNKAVMYKVTWNLVPLRSSEQGTRGRSLGEYKFTASRTMSIWVDMIALHEPSSLVLSLDRVVKDR